MLAAENLKICSICNTPKPFSDFPRDRKSSSGRCARCKACRASHYLEHREEALAKIREWRSRPGSKEIMKARQRKWNRRHMFYQAAMNVRYEHPHEPTASKYEVARLWKSQRGCCALTGARLDRDNAHLDHIIPISRGGSGDIHNLRWLHKTVNYAKRDMLDTDFVLLCKKVFEWSTSSN